MDFEYSDVAKMIDHSLLNPSLTEVDLESGCRRALAYDVASVCILPYYLKRCSELQAGTTVKPSTTILMRRCSPVQVQVKAAGGIREIDALLKVRDLGVTRCGASRTKEMMDEARRRLGLPAIQSQPSATVTGY